VKTKLEPIIDRLAPKMSRAFQDAALQAQERIDLEVLAANVEAGSIGRAVRALGMETFTGEDLSGLAPFLVQAHAAGRLLGAEGLQIRKAEPRKKPALELALDVTNVKALEAAEEQAADLLTAVNLETKATVRGLIARAYKEQITAHDTARLIRDVVGLNDRQATALFNYRAGLVEDGRAADQVSRMSERYGNRLLRQRADTIAQTEIHRASAEGQHELWREGVMEGFINPATARRIWIANEGACEWCEAVESLNADGVPIDGQFQTPDGDSIDGPEESHVGCRCSSGLETG
jgi:hypothetical protein